MPDRRKHLTLVEEIEELLDGEYPGVTESLTVKIYIRHLIEACEEWAEPEEP